MPIKIKKSALPAKASVATSTDAVPVAAAGQSQIMAAMPAELLTVNEAAGLAKVCHHTVRRWIRTGKLAAYNSGMRVRVDRAEVLKFLCNMG